MLRSAAGKLKTLWVRSPKMETPIPVSITDGKLDVKGTGMSVAPQLGCYWSYLQPVSTVTMHIV